MRRLWHGTGGNLDDKTRLIAAVLHSENLEPNDTIMVGDRSHDMIGARANGLRAVGGAVGLRQS